MRLWAVGSEPWANEPDREEWVSSGGSRCLARRGLMGAWCGYVAVVVGHPWHGLSWDEVPASVHGDRTWVGPLSDEGSTWWVGFDCGHGGTDVIPALAKLRGLLPARLAKTLFVRCEYRDLAYVRKPRGNDDGAIAVAATGETYGEAAVKLAGMLGLT